MTYDDARAALTSWRASYPEDPYAAHDGLRALLAAKLEPTRFEALETRASEFARSLVSIVAPAVKRTEQAGHQPELERFDAFGNVVERIVVDPAQYSSGGAVWASGLVAMSNEPGSAFEQATILYLLSLEGEAGLACPATCTIGLARALRRAAAGSVRDHFLPRLLVTDYAVAELGAQFLTEVQGGSDVGANLCVAEATGDGATYRITGEKWFCSVANADQFFMTARVPGGADGTRGLGSFVVPRVVDGEVNGFSIRRLKDKLGTRSLASGEIDFRAALAWPVGPIDDGFRTAVSIVLNTSRWLTAVGSAGIMHRAVLEARSYARFRSAFGSTIDQFASTRRVLAGMIATSNGALALVLALTELEDQIDRGDASNDDILHHRFLVNLTKYLVSHQATDVVRSGIEVLGGNGTIEDFSVLPRLYRDAIVYESWEGTHNVLVAQVLNDVRRLALLDVVRRRFSDILDRCPDVEIVATTRRALMAALDDADRAVDDASFGSWHFRATLDRIGVLGEVTYLLESGDVTSACHLVDLAGPRDSFQDAGTSPSETIDALCDRGA